MRSSLQYFQGRKNCAPCLLSIAICLFSLLFSHASIAKTDTIAIISSSNSPIFTTVIDTIKSSVSRNNRSITFQTFYADNLAATEIDRINNSDLLITIGQRAMLSVLNHSISTPVLATLVPRQSFETNHSSLTTSNREVAAIYIDPPIERQILLAKLLLGEKQTLAILFSNQSKEHMEYIFSTVKKYGLKFQTGRVSSSDNVIRKLSITLNTSNALLALPDPLIFNRNTARNILLTTYRKRIPVIGFSENYVKAGALAATFSTPEQIARQVGKTIINILSSPSSFPSGGKHPEEFDIALNENVARSLGVRIQDTSILKNKLMKMMAAQK